MQIPDEARARCCIEGCWNQATSYDGRCDDCAPTYDY
jgi:hypothetical protein